VSPAKQNIASQTPCERPAILLILIKIYEFRFPALKSRDAACILIEKKINLMEETALHITEATRSERRSPYRHEWRLCGTIQMSAICPAADR
jgi:hypothetical protein